MSGGVITFMTAATLFAVATLLYVGVDVLLDLRSRKRAKDAPEATEPETVEEPEAAEEAAEPETVEEPEATEEPETAELAADISKD